ncbi:antitoxin MazE family protein [Bosea sp. PAMC 26642]|uniref:antitoxin MazE family protein n=1 Tax=Bosea sp. (strain PAMC 26642) TaxID=1792307 RepID=UPI0009EB6E77|nr:antitoxin MazE family protein [Bosea sp. PAMC 26642]
MPRTAASKPAQSKFARYRASKKRQGLKLLRIWVPDVNAPGFAEEAARQAAIINAAPDNAEIMAFIDASTLDWDQEPYDWGPDGPPPWPDHLDDKSQPK